MVVLQGRSVECATCGARGELGDDLKVRWTDLDCSVITMTEKRAHYREILDTARHHADRREEIDTRAGAFEEYDRLVRPAEPAPRRANSARV